MTIRLQNSRSQSRSGIEEICAQFADATGWPLQFLPERPGRAEAVRQRLQENPRCCWFSEIHDGQNRFGYLHLDLPDDSRIDHSFLSVCGLAEAVVRLMSRYAEAARLLESRNREIATLVDLGRTVPREDDLLNALEELLKASVQLTGFRAAGFFLLEPRTQSLHLRAIHQRDGQQIPCPRRDLAASPPDLQVLNEGTQLIHRRLSPALDEWFPENCQMALCVPVQSDSGPIGTVWAFDRRDRVPTNRERHVLESLAAQIATVLERVVLLKQSATQHRLQKELQIVSQSQPGRIEPVADEAGFAAAAVCRSRHELGGDLCELIAIAPGQTVVAVGDASGDSIPAAIVMTAVRGALRALLSGPAEDVLHTERIMDRINRALFHVTPAHQFMTFFYGVLDTAAMSLTYTNAGHPQPILLHEGEATALESHGMLLGVTDDAEYHHSVVKLSPGDVLILFSDGIVEAMSRKRQMFRSDGIVSALAGCADGSAQDIMEAIWRSYETHTAGSGSQDDRTLLVIRLAE